VGNSWASSGVRTFHRGCGSGSVDRPSAGVEAGCGDDDLGDVLRLSLPHRSQDEVRGIAASFVGVTTWQAVCDRFRIDRSVLNY
jgi:hypothetical protein